MANVRGTTKKKAPVKKASKKAPAPKATKSVAPPPPAAAKKKAVKKKVAKKKATGKVSKGSAAVIANRNRKRDAGLTEVRSLWLHPDEIAKVRAYVAKNCPKTKKASEAALKAVK